MSSALLFSSYFPPVQYFSKLLLHEDILMEHFEYFQKQTYRNRCHIYGANGLLKLTIPVMHGMGEHTPVKEVQIANDSRWQKIHWRSVESAYRCSPYFEFYEDALKPLYHKEYKYLADFNRATLEIALSALKFSVNVEFTKNYQVTYPENISDYRNSIHPKTKKDGIDKHFNPKPYYQVFGNKYGFIANLSILDLLCNEGPNSKSYLESCIA